MASQRDELQTQQSRCRGRLLRSACLLTRRAWLVTHTDVAAAQRRSWNPQRDDLTDLPNRAAMLELIDAALADAAEGGPGTAAALPRPGRLQDRQRLPWATRLATRCCREVAGRLVDQVRPGDAVGRLGSRPFLVLARGCDSDGGRGAGVQAATRLRRALCGRRS